MAQYFIYNTCGTSTLTNPARGNKELLTLLNSNSNVKNRSEISDEAYNSIEKLWESQIELWSNYKLEEAQLYSAEINSLTTWQKTNNVKNEDCYCYLLHTDTILGELSAHLVEEWIKSNNYMGVELVAMEGLNTKNLDSFENGLSNFAKWAFENISNDSSDNLKCIFNVAGGFKSVSGFMQILGQFLADETIYMFEGKGSVLSMPKLPVIWSEIDSIEKNFDDYHKISLGIELEDYSYLNSLWIRNKTFSPWGQIAWENAKKELYTKKVWPTVCDKIIEGSKFRDSLKGLDALRIKIINERLDDLSTYTLSDRKINVRRLDYKMLKGRYDCTHECDAWADGDAKRIFCNEKEDKIIVEFLGNALH